MTQTKMKRKNFIDGLPASYDYNYVLKTEKRCKLCRGPITETAIESNSVVCTENFDFLHRECIDSKGLEIVYAKPKDPTSMVKLLIKKTSNEP